MDTHAPTPEQQRALLSALGKALMTMDQPTDLTPVERESLEGFTDAVARAHGYKNWLEAYHDG